MLCYLYLYTLYIYILYTCIIHTVLNGEGLSVTKTQEPLKINKFYYIYIYIYIYRLKFCTAAAAKLRQSCPTLCDPIDGSPPGSPVPGILQARTLEWVAISFSNAWKWKVKVKLFSRVRLFPIPWTAAYQAPPSMGFSRREHWSGVPLPPPKFCTAEITWVKSKQKG